MPALNSKHSYHLIIKTINLVLLSSCAIHAAEDNDMYSSMMPMTSTQSTDVESNERVREDSTDVNTFAFTDEIKNKADEFIAKMFEKSFFSDGTSVKTRIEQSFTANQPICIQAWKSCAAMTDFPSKKLIHELLKGFSNKPLIVFALAIHHNIFFPEDMNNCSKREMMRALSRLSGRSIMELAEIITTNPLIFAGVSDNNEKCMIIQELACCSGESLSEFIEIIINNAGIFLMDMRGCNVVKDLARCSLEKIIKLRDIISNNADLLFGQTKNMMQKAAMIKNLTDLSMEKMLAIMSHKENLFMSAKDISDRSSLITTLRDCSLNKINLIGTHAKQLLRKDMKRSAKSAIIKSFNRLSDEAARACVEAIVNYKTNFFTLNMDGENRAQIINAISACSIDEIEAIAAHADKLFKPNMGGEDRAALITTLGNCSLNKINIITTSAQDLFIKGLSSNHKITIISAINRLSDKDASQYVNTIMDYKSQFLTANMSGDDWCLIIEFLFSRAVNEIEAIAVHAHDLFKDDMDTRDRIQVMRSFLTDSLSQYIPGQKRSADDDNDRGEDEDGHDDKRQRHE